MKNRRSGFTLLEVLVVLAILLVGLGVLIQLQNAALRQSLAVEEKTSIQVACQNQMDRILAGAVAVRNNAVLSIPGFDNWSMSVRLENAPLPNLVRIRIVAQKFEKRREPNPDRPGVFHVIQRPVDHLTIAQWARLDSIRVGGRNGRVSLEARDSAGTTGSGPLTGRVTGGNGVIGGGLGGEITGNGVRGDGVIGGMALNSPVADPFSGIDALDAFSSFSTPDPFAASGFSPDDGSRQDLIGGTDASNGFLSETGGSP